MGWSDEFVAAQASLIRQYSNNFDTFVVPCYVASGNCANPGQLSYSEHNTLYLTVHCPRVQPEVVVISDHGRTTTDFSDVSIGPFVMLNCLRQLKPNSSHTVLVSFTPHMEQVFQEVLRIHCPDSTLSLTVKGTGVQPVVSLSVEDNLMDLGAVIVGEYREETFKRPEPPSSINNEAINHLPQVPINEALDDPPTLLETQKAIRLLSSGKAPGSDSIPAEV
ncbi:Cilia- and flagella-associated protein 74 [Lamellibrachia satsuma]|nr:Cilia- and flagella-associated protein 74 [Lamellibrachia satsuma]